MNGSVVDRGVHRLDPCSVRRATTPPLVAGHLGTAACSCGSRGTVAKRPPVPLPTIQLVQVRPA
jgi:hypothetical protein